MRFWGGDNELYNYHYLYPHQRYAIDLVIKENHKTYKNQGKVNTDYFCFEKISLRQQMVQLKSSEWGSRQQYWKYE